MACGLICNAFEFSFTKPGCFPGSLAELNRLQKAEGGEKRLMDIGKKIRSLRLQRGLTQQELGDRCELSKGFISQLETNQASPSIATLTDLLESLGSSLPEFFREEKNEKIVFTPQDMFVKENGEELKGSITWLVPDAQKNSMEPILIQMDPGGRSETFPPHEGEEFGYVLSGSIFLVQGGKKLRVRSGCSFCIHPKEEHWLENAGKLRARALWVSNPPSF